MATIEFRDGTSEVPDYIADILAPYLDRLYQITRDQAFELANRELVQNVVRRKESEILREHFKGLR